MSPRKKTARNPKSPPEIIGYLLLLLAVVSHLYLIVHFNFTQDDAFITFRYAANFLSGDGLVYNAGERVEGYTNFLWLIWLILGGQLGFDFILMSKLLGVLFGTATVIMTFFVSAEIFSDVRRSHRIFFSGAASLMVGTTYSFAYWAVSGLEMSAFAFFVLLAIYVYLKRSYILIPVGVLGIMLRPEGGLVIVFLILYEIIRNRGFTRYSVWTLAVSAIFLLPYAIFKLQYYGFLIPNTFYAKTGFESGQVLDGLSYAGHYLYHYWGAGIFMLPAIIVLRRASARQWLFLLFSAVYTLYIVVIGGDVLKVHRFFVPLMPVFIIIVLWGVYRMPGKWVVSAVSVAVILAWQLYVPFAHVATFHERELQLTDKMNTLTAMLKMSDRSEFSIAVSTIGLVGYRLKGHTVIDLLGLTDTTIARHPEEAVAGIESTWRESHFNSRYVLSRQPDYILFSTGRKPSAPAERALFLYSAFIKSYRTINFYIGRGLNAVFKRYYAVEGNIERDTDYRFGHYFNLAINLKNDRKDYPGSLAALDSAEKYCPVPGWPYFSLYRAMALNQMGKIEESYRAMKHMVELDTLAVEAYLNLVRYESKLGNIDTARDYYDRVMKLSPWHKPIMDRSLDSVRR